MVVERQTAHRIQLNRQEKTYGASANQTMMMRTLCTVVFLAVVFCEGIFRNDLFEDDPLPSPRNVKFTCPNGIDSTQECDHVCPPDPFQHLDHCPRGCSPLYKKPKHCRHRHCDCGDGGPGEKYRSPSQICHNEDCEWKCSLRQDYDAWTKRHQHRSNKCTRGCRLTEADDICDDGDTPNKACSPIGCVYICPHGQQQVLPEKIRFLGEYHTVVKGPNPMCHDKSVPIKRCVASCD